MAVQVVEGVLALIGLALVADVTGKVIYGLRRRRRMMAEWVAAGGPLRRLVANDWWNLIDAQELGQQNIIHSRTNRHGRRKDESAKKSPIWPR